MALIGSLAKPSTGVFNLDFLPEWLLVENTDQTQGMSNLSVVTSGTQLFSITNEERINAVAQFDSGSVSGQPAAYIKLATGRINKATTINTTTVAGIGTAEFYAASTCMNNIARRAVEQSINPSANATFTNFEALFFLPANILRAQITFSNGFTDEYTTQEMGALYGKFHVSTGAGLLSNLLCIDADSGAGQISQVVLFNSSGGSTVVLKTDYVQL